MEENKNSTASKIKNLYIESNIDINCNEDSVKSRQVKLDKIAVKELVKDLEENKVKVKKLEEKIKYLVKSKNKLALENTKLKKEIQKYKTEKNNQIYQVSKEKNLILINKDVQKQKLYEKIERLEEELKLKENQIKFITSLQDEKVRQIIIKNGNLVLNGGKKESEIILAKLQKHNPNLNFGRNFENNEIKDIYINENLLNNNNKESPVDKYNATVNNEANRQNNNIEDNKTEYGTQKSRPISFDNQNIEELNFSLKDKVIINYTLSKDKFNNY